MRKSYWTVEFWIYAMVIIGSNFLTSWFESPEEWAGRMTLVVCSYMTARMFFKRNRGMFSTSFQTSELYFFLGWNVILLSRMTWNVPLYFTVLQKLDIPKPLFMDCFLFSLCVFGLVRGLTKAVNPNKNLILR